AELLDRTVRSTAGAHDLDELATRVSTVADGARCSLATQQQVIAGALLDRKLPLVRAHVERTAPPTVPTLVAELTGLDDGVAHVDEHHAAKQPDWSFDVVDSGQSPASRFGEHRERRALDE